jgi:hypothetical protein
VKPAPILAGVILSLALARTTRAADQAPLHEQREAQLKQSVHARLACTDCHPRGVDPVLRPKMEPIACGACHPAEAAIYRESIHGMQAAQGNPDVPTCQSCHGSHAIARVSSKSSRVSLENLPQTCSTCHESMVISRKYGIPGRRYSTYLESFHGEANRFGQTTVANCASCHGTHNIFPQSDPRSTIAPRNLVKTCGQCHPHASENFARGKVHVEATPQNSKGVFIVRTFYYWFIGILVSLFALHITLELYGRARRRLRPEVKP